MLVKNSDSDPVKSNVVLLEPLFPGVMNPLIQNAQNASGMIDFSQPRIVANVEFDSIRLI